MDPPFVGIQTRRFNLRLLNDADASFILGLLNEPDWLKYIGDRGVHTLNDAKAYIHSGPLAMIKKYGFGLYLVERQEDHMPVGLCGLLQRDGLSWPDIGFAYCAQFRRQGIAFEVAQATLEYAQSVLGLTKVAALTAINNEASIGLLRKLGFAYERQIALTGQAETSNLYFKTL